MESISSLLKISLPIYFRNLPIPNYFGGFAKLSGKFLYKDFRLVGFHAVACAVILWMSILWSSNIYLFTS